MAQDDPVRIIPHTPEGIPDCGSFEVHFADGRPSEYFYWDDNPGRRSITKKMDQAEALEKARRLARAEREKLEHTCPCCDDTGWVCEEHPDQPWDGPHACSCGAAGAAILLLALLGSVSWLAFKTRSPQLISLSASAWVAAMLYHTLMVDPIVLPALAIGLAGNAGRLPNGQR